MVCYALDLSAQKAAVELLRTSEHRYRTLADALPHIVMVADADRTLIYANRRYEEFTGIPAAEFAERWREPVHPDDLPAVERARATGEPYEIEYRLRRAADGAYRWHFARVQRVATDGIAWLASAMDIDDRKLAEEALAEMYRREHRVAQALQEAALPRTLPVVSGFTLDAHYRAGRDEAAIGGDWFDAIVVDGRLVISVGDVAGNGLRAAVTMGNVRQLLRGAAHASIDPLAMLDIADRTLRSERHAGIVTAFVGVIDIARRRMRCASAGHVPALLRMPDGVVRTLELPGPPLGCRDIAAGEHASIDLLPGSRLLLYTDGLVEWSRDIIAGEERLRTCFADAFRDDVPSVREFVDRVVAGGAMFDDIAALSVFTEA